MPILVELDGMKVGDILCTYPAFVLSKADIESLEADPVVVLW